MPHTVSSERLIDRACAGAVLGFGLWTLICNAVVLAQGNLHQLLVAGLACGLLGGIALVVARRRGRTADDVAAPAAPRTFQADNSTWIRSPGPHLAAGAALTLGFVYTQALELVWVVSVVYLALALLSLSRGNELTTDCTSVPARGAKLVWLLALGFALLPLFAHRGSPDDGYYLNVAVHAVDDPTAPLLTYDTLHGIPDVPIMYAVYKTHSFEILGAAIAWLSGLSATQACHWILPAFFGFFLALAWATLVRRLAPRNWLWIWLATMAVLLCARQGNQDAAAFSLLRLQQGKSVFISVFFPLLLLYGMQFSTRPTRAGWMRLGAAQIASIGMTSTALWAAPLVAALGLAAGASFTLRSAKRVLLGLASSSYVVLLGAYLAGQMFAADAAALVDPDGVRLVRVTADPISASDELVRSAFEVVFGSGAFALFALFSLAAGWASAPSAALRRVIVVPALAVLLALANPYFAMEVAARITGGSTYWRVFWLIPIPLAIGVLLSFPSRFSKRNSGAPLTTIAVICFLATVPRQFNFSNVRWEPLGLKVPGPKVYDTALHVREVSPPGSPVLAPAGIAPWIVSLHHHPYPLSSRPNWMNAVEARIGRSEADRRRLLLRFVTGYVEPDGPAALMDAVDDYGLTSVTLLRGIASTKSARQVLRAKDFERSFTNEEYETWIRP